jgi:hypothetical protein
MSVVGALSERLVHTNVRDGGAWTATYRRGVSDCRPVFGAQAIDVEHLRALLTTVRSPATVTLTTP